MVSLVTAIYLFFLTLAIIFLTGQVIRHLFEGYICVEAELIQVAALWEHLGVMLHM